MIIEHSILNKQYNIDCEKYEIKKVINLKSFLLNSINGVTIENIKFIYNSREMKNEELITNDIQKINMVIIPIKCGKHMYCC